MRAHRCEKHGEYFGDFCPGCAQDRENARPDDEWWEANLPAVRLASLQSLLAERNRLESRLASSSQEAARLRRALEEIADEDRYSHWCDRCQGWHGTKYSSGDECCVVCGMKCDPWDNECRYVEIANTALKEGAPNER